ncbi:adenylate kinase [Phorcysia thermohydrogeniphila]|uniref:Adenylate kinase n=1 Tax=Phorcysia thermohydrogeniphila TaxID=936138 RepID=A0A4R1GBI8_9BACT|nr:adenylate kinase [Phorcysia thermohydrogeniphila]
MIKVVFLGPPGAGKGTQAVRIAEKYNVPHISTGDILRAAVKEGTELGKLAKSYMDRGELVPDEVIIGIIRERLSQPDVKERGFILDGFPRTIAQAEALDELLKELQLPLDKVIYLNVDDEEIVKRLLARGRADDTEDVIRNRLKVYREQTAPLVDYYTEKGLLVEICGVGEIEEITKKIEESLGLND